MADVSSLANKPDSPRPKKRGGTFSGFRLVLYFGARVSFGMIEASALRLKLGEVKSGCIVPTAGHTLHQECVFARDVVRQLSILKQLVWHARRVVFRCLRQEISMTLSTQSSL
jgi:hypothetical protein